MCSDKKLQLAKNGKALVFEKNKFYITTLITIMILFTGIVFAFSDIRGQAKTNCDDIDVNRGAIVVNARDITEIKRDVDVIDQIDFNIKNICINLGIEYIGGNK